jgi:hypothetical protein
MRHLKTLTAAVVGLTLSVATSQATISLPLPSGAVTPPAYVPGAGATPLATLTSSYTQSGFTGTVTTWVMTGDVNNTPLGGLSFWYQIHNTGSDAFEGLSLGGFGALAAQVGYITTAVAAATGSVAGTAIPSDATRATTVHWDFVGFLGGPPLGPASGTYSDILVVNTAATTWGVSNGSVQDTLAQNLAILAPLAAVPEPTTVIAGALLLLPLGASTIRILRRNRAA